MAMGARPRIRLREVRHADDPAVAQAHALLRRHFHSGEMVDRGDWEHSLREQAADLWTDIAWHLVVAEVDSQVVGAATGNYLGNVNHGMIGYLVVERTTRGREIGRRLRTRLRTLFERDARRIAGKPLRAILGEVRLDNPWLRTLTRHHLVLPLDFRYLQPRLRRWGRTISLVLYYETFDRRRRQLSSRLLKKLLYTVWRRIYRIARPLQHAPFREMLRELEQKPAVGRLAIPPLGPKPGDPNA
jgi:GNAT superfamily N-acetyltransferase